MQPGCCRPGLGKAGRMEPRELPLCPCMSMSDVWGGNGLGLSAAPLMAMLRACGSPTRLFATSRQEDCVRRGPGSCIPMASAVGDEAVEARRARRAHPPGEVSPAQMPFADHLEEQASCSSQQLSSPNLSPLCGPGSPKCRISSLQEGMQQSFKVQGLVTPDGPLLHGHVGRCRVKTRVCQLQSPLALSRELKAQHEQAEQAV